MTIKTLTISDQETQVLLNLINLAVKAVGLDANVAENGVYFKKKFESLFSAPEEGSAVETKKEG